MPYDENYNANVFTTATSPYHHQHHQAQQYNLLVIGIPPLMLVPEC
jgi:hypothetical protein